MFVIGFFSTEGKPSESSVPLLNEPEERLFCRHMGYPSIWDNGDQTDM